jgi:hypothetical protein
MLFERGHFSRKIVQESFITESLKEVRAFSSKTAYSRQPTVFLSHKHDDLKELQGVIGELNELDVKVYIDSMDNKMPEQTSGDTALRIRDVIKYCNKFILLATEKAIESYWCNWELGIGDTYKFDKHIAIIPIKEKGTYDFEFKGNEYLQIYPYIEYRDGTTKYSNGGQIVEGYYVRTPVDKENHYTIEPLRTWLHR